MKPHEGPAALNLSRRLMPWWLLRRLDAVLPTCWAGMAMWKTGYDWSWRVNGDCFGDDSGNDYCGKFVASGERYKVCRKRTRPRWASWDRIRHGR